MKRAALSVLLFSIVQTVPAHFVTPSLHSLKVPGSCSLAFLSGAGVHSLFNEFKKNNRATAPEYQHIIRLVGLGMPILADILAKQCPRIVQNKNNNALLLSICASMGWMVSRVIWEYE